MLHHRLSLPVTHVLSEAVMQLSILKITTLTAYLIQVFPFLTSDEREKLQVLQNQADLLVLAKKKKIKHYWKIRLLPIFKYP